MEKDLQNIIENNIETVFDYEFICSEFAVRNFRIDTLAYDPGAQSFVILEYKRDKSTSIVDQGLAYLNVLLDNKAEFVLKYNEIKKMQCNKQDINWESSKVMFVANSFTLHQHQASSFKDLPIELWEVNLYDNKIISFSKIESQATNVLLKSLSKDKTIQKVTKEIKKYELDDLFQETWKKSRSLFEELRSHIIELDDGISENFTKFYIAYRPKDGGRSFTEIVSQKQGLKIFLRPKIDQFTNHTSLQLEDCEIKGHWTNGNTQFLLKDTSKILEALTLIKQAYDIET